jgi:DNA repair protein RadC
LKTIKQIEIKAKRLTIAAEDREVYSTTINSPREAIVAARTLLKDTDEEYFVAIPVDVKNKPLGIQIVSKGSVDRCPVDPKSVFRAAIVMGAAAVIVGHNHPSGDVVPSKEDLETTRRLVECGKFLGLPVLDHLIITDIAHSSLRESNESLWS